MQISYSYPGLFNLTNSAFNGFTISGPLTDAPIAGASVDVNSTVTGLTNASLAFTADSVTVNLAGDTFSAGSSGLIDVQFAVPEPGSLLLLASGASGRTGDVPSQALPFRLSPAGGQSLAPW